MDECLTYRFFVAATFGLTGQIKCRQEEILMYLLLLYVKDFFQVGIFLQPEMDVK